MRCIDLWHDFAKKQEKEGEYDGLDDEDQEHRGLLVVDDLRHEEGEQCNNCDIDQVVAYQYRSHESLRLLEKLIDQCVVGMFFVFEFGQIAWSKREKRYLRCRNGAG